MTDNKVRLGRIERQILTELQRFTDDQQLRDRMKDKRHHRLDHEYSRGLVRVGTSRAPSGYLDEWMPTLWIRGKLLGQTTNSKKASFSRALKTLKAQCLIECGNEQILSYGQDRLAALRKKYDYYPGSDKYTTHIRLTEEGRKTLTLLSKVRTVNTKGEVEP